MMEKVSIAPISHLRRIADLDADSLAELLELAEAIDAEPLRFADALPERRIACAGDASFIAAVELLGATVSNRRPDAMVINSLPSEVLDEFARYTMFPLINAREPFAILGDLLTIKQEFTELRGRHMAFLGHGDDDLARALIEGCALAGVHARLACPSSHLPHAGLVRHALALASDTGASIQVCMNPASAVVGAHAVYAGVPPYWVTDALMSLAQPGAVVLQQLPAVVDAGPLAGTARRQRENRLPTAAAILLTLLRSTSW